MNRCSDSSSNRSTQRREQSSYEKVSEWVETFGDSPLLSGCGCELLIPFILVGWLLFAVAGASIKAAERVKLVSPRWYPACRASRVGARAGAAAAFLLCGACGLCAAVGLTCVAMDFEGGSRSIGFPLWLLAASTLGAILSAFLNVNLRSAAASLEAIKPASNEYADGLPADQTLLRSANPSDVAVGQQLLRPAEGGPDSSDGSELGHVSGE